MKVFKIFNLVPNVETVEDVLKDVFGTEIWIVEVNCEERKIAGLIKENNIVTLSNMIDGFGIGGVNFYDVKEFQNERNRQIVCR